MYCRSVQEYHKALRSFSVNSLVREPYPREVVADSKCHTEILIKREITQIIASKPTSEMTTVALTHISLFVLCCM